MILMIRTSGEKRYAHIPEILEPPNLIEIQHRSFQWFIEEGLKELFDEISPIESLNGQMRLYFPGDNPVARQLKLRYWFDEPKYSELECLERDLTYGRGMWVQVALIVAGREPMVKDVFFGEIPWMTRNGTFIYNGTERVVVSQLIRSPGVYFDMEEDPSLGRPLAMAKLIPDRGVWLEFETRRNDLIILRFNRRRTVPVTLFLRALAATDDGISRVLTEGTDEELLELFKDVDTHPDHPYILSTIRQEGRLEPREGRTLAQEALIEFFRRMRPGDPPTLENAQSFVVSQLFDPHRYDLHRVGRYKLNRRLDLSIPISHRTITKQDIIAILKEIIRINNGLRPPDDMDHLGNRRVRTVGELIQAKMRVGLRRMERVIQERMSIADPATVTPLQLINIRPVVAALREFFGSSQLSQFMDQTNPLAELTHKRTLSALGPGGLRRERAGFEVRDVHLSHYGRICPIETPEGPNIGLIGRLAIYSRVNEYGFIETPYRKVVRVVLNRPEALVGRILREDVVDPATGQVIAPAGTEVDAALAKRIARLPLQEIKVRPFVTGEIVYLTADEEERYVIAQANVELDEKGHFLQARVPVRHMGKFLMEIPERVDYMDVAPRQIVGVSASLIPFLEHDDANRALMGSNMQRQAVPLLRPEAPIVATGMERVAARDSGHVLLSEVDGEVVQATADEIVIRGTNRKLYRYPLRRFQRSNQSTCIHQRPLVFKGQKVKKGQVIADSSSTDQGMLALGRNLVVAFLSWEGQVFEDAIVISERLVREDIYSSIHIEKHEAEARETKLGPEEITRDIPNVGEEQLRDLDEKGIVRIGAVVGPGDILVGKVTPKGEREMTPEERLLRAIFGEKAHDVKDSSLRMPHGEHGKVVDVKVFSRDEYRELPAGVNTVVRVSVAQWRKITEGDKMAGRHGNKGVISKVVPIEDMPFLPDGTPVDIILNPLGVPSRMNIGQLLETHLGWAASRLGFRAITPVFDGADEQEIEAELARAWMIDTAWEDARRQCWSWLQAQGYNLSELRDDDEARLLYLSAILGARGYDVDRLATDEVYARRSCLREWLRDRGYDPDALLVFEDDPRPPEERRKADERAILVGLRLWMERLGVDTRDIPDSEVRRRATEVMLETGQPMPILGKMILYDGKTGEPFDRPVTVGVIYMMKLAHLVEDKVHARSTGPYSLITQQPLGGKAQFGGQRFGEMEVWALEAYGAAYTLQEMLTVKSDDVQGRVKTYEAIVKGQKIEEPGLPASFKVLVKELQSLAVAVEAITDSGEVIRFGREEEKPKLPRLPLGLLDLAPEGDGETPA
jgi:DNA-directed RNA polymerase subunit beta